MGKADMGGLKETMLCGTAAGQGGRAQERWLDKLFQQGPQATPFWDEGPLGDGGKKTQFQPRAHTLHTQAGDGTVSWKIGKRQRRGQAGSRTGKARGQQ